MSHFVPVLVTTISPWTSSTKLTMGHRWLLHLHHQTGEREEVLCCPLSIFLTSSYPAVIASVVDYKVLGLLEILRLLGRNAWFDSGHVLCVSPRCSRMTPTFSTWWSYSVPVVASWLSRWFLF